MFLKITPVTIIPHNNDKKLCTYDLDNYHFC